LPCARTRRMTNIYVCRAFSHDARQNFLKNWSFVLLFISPLQEHYFVLYISILYMSQLIYYF
jgi:hypothetical protein